MTGWESLRSFLSTDPADAGCGETFTLLDRYVERELARGDARLAFPRVAAHLDVCGPCAEDVRGLIRGKTRACADAYVTQARRRRANDWQPKE
jgi:hypothetical protein